MPLIPAGYAQVGIPMRHDGLSHVAFVTFGVQDQVPSANPTELAETIWTPWNDNMVPITDTNVSVGPVHVQVNYGAGTLSGDGTSTAVGGSADNRPPPQVCWLGSKHSLEPGRSGRGRMYMPFSVTDDSVDEVGVISGGTVDSFQAAVDALISDLSAAEVPMVILHNAAGTPAPVVSITVQSLVATQRRRVGR
jgi:hypothetical protein